MLYYQRWRELFRGLLPGLEAEYLMLASINTEYDFLNKREKAENLLSNETVYVVSSRR
jgi:hypothetical protein